MKRILATLGIAIVLIGATTAEAVPIPGTPCAAIMRGRHPLDHVPYWRAHGWAYSRFQWVDVTGSGCWGDP